MSSDIVINTASGFISGTPISIKPTYLILLENLDGKKSLKRFIAVDRPVLPNGFVQVKGFFSEMSEEEIINNYQVILTSIKKDIIIEVMFPLHKINYIRSLIFKAK